MAAVAQLRQLAINLLVVGLPEETDRGIEGLGELIARHRPLGQAGEDRVGKRHGGVSLVLLDFMHIGAYASMCIWTDPLAGGPCLLADRRVPWPRPVSPNGTPTSSPMTMRRFGSCCIPTPSSKVRSCARRNAAAT